MRGSPGLLGPLLPRDKERLFSRALPRSVFGPTRVDAGNAENIVRFVMDQPVASDRAAKASPVAGGSTSYTPEEVPAPSAGLRLPSPGTGVPQSPLSGWLGWLGWLPRIS